MSTRFAISALMTAALLLTVSARELSAETVEYALDNGDTNGDLTRELSDAVHLVSYLFRDTAPPVPLALCGGADTAVENGDSNGDGLRDLSDVVHFLSWQFSGGLEPALACGDGFGASAGPRVLPRNGQNSQLYSRLAARWWQWALSLPATDHPLADETGENCDAGQSGNVWFLGGAFAIVDPDNPFAFIAEADRVCQVPKGKFIFFPILNTGCDTFEANFPSCTATDEELVECAKEFAPDPTAPNVTVEAEVDGTSIENLDRFLTFSSPFDFTLDEDDPFVEVATEETDPDTGEIIPCPIPRPLRFADSGVYILMAPLRKGTHHIHFFGKLVFSEDPLSFFQLTIDYTLIVGN